MTEISTYLRKASDSIEDLAPINDRAEDDYEANQYDSTFSIPWYLLTTNAPA